MINYESATGPFSHSENTSVRIMYIVILTLLPTVVFGVYQFGLNSLYILSTCCVVAVATELLCLKVMVRNPKACIDGSALLTALLLAISLPPTAPLWLCALGSAFAIIVGKQIFGGLGQNLFNPAMVARVMLLICFPVEMTNWSMPVPIDFSNNQLFVPQEWFHFDGVTAATALSGVVDQTTEFTSLFLGTHSGSLGETSTLLILAGGLYLIYKGIIHWAIPVSFLLGIAIPALISSSINSHEYLSVSTHLFSGAAMLGAFYIATDLVTSPTSVRGQLVYGASCGVLIWLIRSFGSYPEGVAFAILIMNSASPLIDHYLRPNIFGSKSAVGK
ncbi:RnfABCDGE type electron transport complex subunit D [Vibrio algarum]|uniref:Ion-translocating oxidoreductase complex subunit D n=1 Tax=Vibrio algarum TaxID=3020714 RepID=A0ABT4YRM3_9VIBR|nr:RnfABCDGE type electron transport complex subunit D [Vibrio sp. KJ40-1]MDB1124135.1 RnfABCDGE type electron transport complex subunit D [Vibrio sp. KJ40-1]